MSRVISYNINPNLNVQAGVHKTYFIIRGRNLGKDEDGNIIPIPTEQDYDKNGFYYVEETKNLCIIILKNL